MAASPLDHHSAMGVPRRGRASLRGAPAPRPEIGPARRGHRAADPSGVGRAARSAVANPLLVADGRPSAAATASRPQPEPGSDRRELLCSVISLAVKIGLVTLIGVTLLRQAGVFQQRMQRQEELAAVLELQTARLQKLRQRFDQLFMPAGEQQLIREQSQWIAPQRLRVVWQESAATAGLQRSAALQR
ncbi:MAG: hypothetical protein VKJ44_09925 [Synechococcus sp.]|nr:hypothetical protein [Synechococcus sp.]